MDLGVNGLEGKSHRTVYVKSSQNLLLSLKQSVEGLEPIAGKEGKME